MASELLKTDKHTQKEIDRSASLELNKVTDSPELSFLTSKSVFSPKFNGDDVFEQDSRKSLTTAEDCESDEELTGPCCMNLAASSELSATAVLYGMQTMASTSSSGSSESTVSCRICKAHGGNDLVLSPCKCKGSMGVVHVSCLEQWLTGSVRDSCELCSVPFNVTRTLKHGCVRSLCIYLRNQVSFPRLFRDLFFLTVSFMNTSVLLYMWLAYVFRDFFTLFSNGALMGKSVGTSPLRGVVYLFFFTLCLVFVFVNTLDDFRRILHFYILPWYHWWQSSVDVKLVVHQNTADKPKKE